ncbi:hypothetical protein BURMUCGD2_3960 [Burkholderia multivorans CGD2]|uniref:Uncharacterized protein n=1 Tax=Burkholderia multivorans CGD2 TaxID=513052 RepID=B9BRE4_9BURK|nr:hypothetical protein BURMUCGD2_3960 [Burkholderia multivorans CGD2]
MILQKPFFCRRELSHSFFTIRRPRLRAAQWSFGPTQCRIRAVFLMQLCRLISYGIFCRFFQWKCVNFSDACASN